MAWEMVRNGLGITVMSAEIAAKFPGIERVLDEIDPFVFPVWLTTHRELHTSRRIRLVFDLLADFLSKDRPKAKRRVAKSLTSLNLLMQSNALCRWLAIAGLNATGLAARSKLNQVHTSSV